MRYYLILLLVFSIGFISCKSEHKNQKIKKEELSVMTYNIRLDVASDGENAWENRKPLLISQIQFYSPNIMGVQEARSNQMNDLRKALKNYDVIGKGRDGGNRGEFSAIFYNPKKVKVENGNTFWLSETPNEVSKGWDAACPRICTYGLFTLLESNQKIWVFNTHLDHLGKEARLKGMALILKKIAILDSGDFPVIVMGDFNVDPDNQLIDRLKQKMNDSKNISKIVFGSDGTFNGFKLEESATRRIDYIMILKSKHIEVEKYGVLSSVIGLKYLSDHFPVYIELILK